MTQWLHQEERVETLCTSVPSGGLVQIKVWDEEQLDKDIDMEQIRVDPSPFQLVERTSLHKVTSFIPYSPSFLRFTWSKVSIFAPKKSRFMTAQNEPGLGSVW